MSIQTGSLPAPKLTRYAPLYSILIALLVGALPVRAATLDIFNAWWSNTLDKDVDGCFAPALSGSGMLLNWDVDVFEAPSAMVYEKVYVRDSGSQQWTLLTTTAPHEVVGNSTDDAQSYEIAPASNCTPRDYKIELYAEGSITLVATRGPDNDSDLLQHREEAFDQDLPAIKIYDAWWTKNADLDGDGCMAPATADGLIRLNWDGDVVGTASISVYERIYSRPLGGAKWNLLVTTTPHLITANSPADAQYIDLAPGSNCVALEFAIELYHQGATVPAYIRDGTNDVDLAARSQESYERDSGGVIADSWWSNVADNNQDGCIAPASAAGFLRLHWDPNVADGSTIQVYEKIFVRGEGAESWTLLRTTAVHPITGALSSDQQYADLVPGSDCVTNEYRIEIFRAGSDQPDSARDYTNDPDLANRREQTYAQDNGTAALRDVWWANVADNDQDGCISSDTSSAYMRLYWDADVTGNGSLQVFERVFWRQTGSQQWTQAYETQPHTIVGTSAEDAQWVVISPGSSCTTYDYRVEVYRIGHTSPDSVRDPANDADLAAHREETWAQDNLRATVADAWWSNVTDNDLDGCFSPAEGTLMRLNYDIDIINGATASVYEKVYSRPAVSTDWTLLQTTAPHNVQGLGTNDAQSVDLSAGAGCAAFDYKIEVFRVSGQSPDFILSPTNSPALANHKEETAAQDTPALTINLAWWSNLADHDEDGCWAPAALEGKLRLNWDPDLSGLGTVLGYEKIYWRASATGAWQLAATNAPHQIGNGDTNDTQFVDLAPRGTCAPADYKIELYQVDKAVADYVRGPSNEPALAGVKHEQYTDDNQVAVVLDAWWTQLADDDQDGCYASDRPDRTQKLNWSMTLSGQGSAPVYEQVWAKATDSTNWIFVASTPVHVLTNQVTPVELGLELPVINNCLETDYRVDVYRQGSPAPEFTLGPTSDEDLASVKLELYTDEHRVAVIANIWWTDLLDRDGDGCFAPATAGGFMRLYWDVDVIGAGSIVVQDKIYSKTTANGAWTLLYTSGYRTISGAAAGDAQYLELPPTPGCAGVDYRIEVYRGSNEFPDSSKDSTNNSNLSQHKEETYVEDTQTAVTTIARAWWSSIKDTDEDGCMAPDRPNGLIRLNWNTDIVGGGNSTVFEKVYWRNSKGSPWTLVGTTSPHLVQGTDESDLQGVDLVPNSGCGLNDYMIEVYRTGNPPLLDYALNPELDPGLSIKEETYSEDPGVAPVIVQQPKSQTVSPGESVNFSVAANGSMPLGYQWFFQATNMIVGASTNQLTILKTQPADAGAYLVVVSNIAGVVTSAVANLVVGASTPPQLQAPEFTQNGFRFRVQGQANARLAVEISTNFTGWNSLAIITNASGNDLFNDPTATNKLRFYRVRNNP